MNRSPRPFTRRSVSLLDGRLDVHPPEVLDRIVSACPPGRPRAIAWVLRSVGCRVGEVLALRGADVGADQVRIPWLKRRGRPRWRTLPLASARLSLAALLREDLAGEEVVFDITVRTAQRWIAAAAAAIGIGGFHPHGFRHGFACEWLSRRGDLVRLQHWLGHSSLATTALYLHSTPEDLRRELERIGPIGAPPRATVIPEAAAAAALG